MHNTASPETHWREQIEAMDALIAAGALSRGRRSVKKGALRTGRHAAPDGPPPSVAPPGAPSVRVAVNGVKWLPVPGWEKLPWLWHGFSTRLGGVTRAYSAPGGQGELNLGFTAGEDRPGVVRNRQLLAEAITGNPETAIITLKQIHSNVVVRTGAADHESEPRRADGQMTAEPGLLLGIMTADCIPVLVADLRRRAVAAFHAGWRGTVRRIVECGIGRMRLEFGSRPEDLRAAIGPGIGACCYAVGEEVRAAFESQFAYARELFSEVYDPDPVRLKYPMLFLNQRAPGHAAPLLSLHLNLAEANRRQLLDAGLKPGQIQCVGGCTGCQTGRFFSYRAEHGRTGRMMAVIGIRNSIKP